MNIKEMVDNNIILKIKVQGIYKIINCINNKVYIGQSNNIIKRLIAHKFASNSNVNYPLYNAIRKYGIENFKLVVIEYVEDSNKLNERETSWIQFYKAFDEKFGYNLLPNGNSWRGFKHQEESKLKMSQSHLGKTTWNKGIPCSEETKIKIAKAQKGKKKSQEFIKNLTGRKLSEEHRKNIGLGGVGKKHSNETRKKLSEKRIEWCKNPDNRKKLSDARKGIPSYRPDYVHSKETRLKISVSNKGKPKNRKDKK